MPTDNSKQLRPLKVHRDLGKILGVIVGFGMAMWPLIERDLEYYQDHPPHLWTGVGVALVLFFFGRGMGFPPILEVDETGITYRPVLTGMWHTDWSEVAVLTILSTPRGESSNTLVLFPRNPAEFLERRRDAFFTNPEALELYGLRCSLSLATTGPLKIARAVDRFAPESVECDLLERMQSVVGGYRRSWMIVFICLCGLCGWSFFKVDPLDRMLLLKWFALPMLFSLYAWSRRDL